MLHASRLAAGLSQEELADRSGISTSTISDIERGVSAAPRPSTLRVLAEALSLSAQARGQLLAAASQGTSSPAADKATQISPPPGPVTLASTLARLRTRAGLSVPELAEMTGLSDRTIRNVEKGQTKRIHPETGRIIADALELNDSERPYFLSLAAGRPALAAGISAPMLPAWLHGRVREYHELLALLRQRRLVTVTGAGGVGKTALATAVSGSLDMPVRWFEFAELPPGTTTMDAITRLFGLDEGSPENILDSLTERLPRGCVLVLDNLEHLDSPGIVVSGLIGKREDICVLATSRVRLDVPEEHEFPLQALDLDAARTLFLEVAERNRGSSATGADPAVIDRICARLDRFPLAVRLAAAWAAVLTPHDILVQLEQPGRILKHHGAGPGRQMSIASTVEWSLRLLPQDAVTLFKELSVYPAPWPLHIAVAVHQTQDVLDGLRQLAEYGLVQADTIGPRSRFGMLQTVQDVGQSMADREPGFRLSVRDRHAAYLLDHADVLLPALTGRDAKATLEQVTADYLHYEAALRHLVAIADARALRLSAALWRYWQYSGKFKTGLSIMRSALRACASDDPKIVAECRYGTAVLAYLAGENADAAADAQIALRLFQDVEDPVGIGAIMSLSGMMCQYSGQLAEAVRWFQDGLGIATWEAAPRSHATLLSNLAVAREAQGEFADARRLSEEAAVRYRMLDDARGVAAQLGNLASSSARAGDIERARDLLNEAQQVFEELHDPAALREVHLELAEFALNEGDAAAASEALRAVEKYGKELDDPWGDSLAASYAAEVLLLQGGPAAATRDAMLAAARAETIGWQPAAIRALLVQAISLALLGRTGEALEAASAGLGKCTKADLTAITSLALVVCAVQTGPRVTRLSRAAAVMAAQPGASPCAAAYLLNPGIGPGSGTNTDEHITASALREEAIELCG